MLYYPRSRGSALERICTPACEKIGRIRSLVLARRFLLNVRILHTKFFKFSVQRRILHSAPISVVDPEFLRKLQYLSSTKELDPPINDLIQLQMPTNLRYR